MKSLQFFSNQLKNYGVVFPKKSTCLGFNEKRKMCGRHQYLTCPEKNESDGDGRLHLPPAANIDGSLPMSCRAKTDALVDLSRCPHLNYRQ